MTTFYLVRHAKAGDRDRWRHPDEERPLTRSGAAQASWLAHELGDAGVERISSSAYVRCVQTVEPLAAKLGLSVEIEGALAEGATLAQSLSLLERCSDRDTAGSSHGDVIADLITHLKRQGVPGIEQPRWQKGSVWVLTWGDGGIARASYVPPG